MRGYDTASFNPEAQKEHETVAALTVFREQMTALTENSDFTRAGRELDHIDIKLHLKLLTGQKVSMEELQAGIATITGYATETPVEMNIKTVERFADLVAKQTSDEGLLEVINNIPDSPIKKSFVRGAVFSRINNTEDVESIKKFLSLQDEVTAEDITAIRNNTQTYREQYTAAAAQRRQEYENFDTGKEDAAFTDIQAAITELQSNHETITFDQLKALQTRLKNPDINTPDQPQYLTQMIDQIVKKGSIDSTDRENLGLAVQIAQENFNNIIQSIETRRQLSELRYQLEDKRDFSAANQTIASLLEGQGDQTDPELNTLLLKIVRDIPTK